MNKLQRFLSILMAAVLLLTCVPALSIAEGEEDAEAQEPKIQVAPEIDLDELLVGHPTITKGDFFTEMFGNNTADIDVRALIHGYNLINWDQNQGTYVFDPSVVRSVEADVNAEGYKQYTLVLADNLKYSDGTPITAWDYAFSILLMMSPEIEEIGGKIYRAEHLVDYDKYIAARRKVIAGEELDPAEDLPYLTGVTVLSDYQIRFWLDPDFLPYFYELGLLMTVPYPIQVIAPGCKVVSGYEDADGPLGIKIVNEDESIAEPIYTADLLRKTILDPETGYNTFPSVVSGPYVIKSWDGVTGHFEINPEFKGAWMVNNLPGGALHNAWETARIRGKIVQDTDEFGNVYTDANGNPVELVLPSIEKISFTVADNDTMIEQLQEGELHLVNKVTYNGHTEDGQLGTIMKGMQAEGINAQPYPRIGLSFLTFTYDWPTVHEKEVRQAIAWCMDREALTQAYCGGFGQVMDGYFGLEQWEYKLVTDRMNFPVNFLETIDALGTPIEYTDDEIEKQRLLRSYKRLATTEEEMDQLRSEWQALVDEWDDGEGHTLLTHYTVDLEKANQLLDRAGWKLNRNGEAYQAGVDDVRCKKIDGEIVALDLKLMYPEGNHMAEFMQQGDEENPSFVDNLASVGIKLTFVPTPMQDLLHSYYRETERTTDMIYLATNFHVIVDPSITYSTDDTVGHKVWNNTYSDDEELFYDAVSMRKTDPLDIYQYVAKWMTFQKRYNEILPTIPVYSNIYYDFYTEYLQNYVITAQVTWTQAILLAYYGEPIRNEAEDLGEEGFGDDDFGDDTFFGD